MSRILSRFIVVFTFLLLSRMPSGFSCGQCHGGGQSGYQDAAAYPSLSEKFFMKVNFLMSHREELKLTKEQVNSINEIVFDIKRAMIEFDSQKSVAMLEIYRQLSAESSDIEAMKASSDKKMEAKKNLEKTVIDHLMRMKGVLTPEQRAQVKELYWEDRYPQCVHSRGGSVSAATMPVEETEKKEVQP